jgi:hypothetical protein
LLADCFSLTGEADGNSDHVCEAQHADFPPAGLFAWHYTQCILKRFATAQFRGLEEVFFPEAPAPYRGDSDNETDWESPVSPPTSRSILYN